MKTALETINTFVIPVEPYPQIAKIQKALLRIIVTHPPCDPLAAARLLSIFVDSDLKPLFLSTVTFQRLPEMDATQLQAVTDLQEVIKQFQSFSATLKIAISESRQFLPSYTVDLLEKYSTAGAPLERLNTATFIVLAANLQEA